MSDILDRILTAVEQVILEYKREKKVANALSTVAKAKERGSFLGRRKIRDDALIAKLRADGLTMRQIAQKSGVSTTAVQRSLAESKK